MGPKLTALLIISLTLTACQSVDMEPVEYQRAQAQTPAEIAFAHAVLDALQSTSIAQNREYCGYIGLDSYGDFAASPPRKGGKSACLPDDVTNDFRLLASYHTHGGYSPDYNSERPSYDDLSADIKEGIDGYIATPGGRLWFNDALGETAVLLCGQSCITADAQYNANDDIDIQDRYGLEDLRALED